ncbi:MAG: Asp-tRNA(Asn)/Glu-tRNA(Gln) amidotransferase subunit GatC [Ignavibacteriaceae bacterium]|jgi:aspartyl/glutamyl-tRNA(Asn/Gln) amidotransferase subunit C (EC 6.3.5.-)|nr:MAG: Asp-tRNA(Asn)/Glu-tRNA(Gln) amidotransferase subunit GatC [Chlorobiota bacterium]KXK03800.1 MAG: aspartyl-tRNA(Asn)/glutamyl-tRNA (Gln) amidotransferase subunit C [Chlorobi bacterium OLB4]MBV6398168.1 Glutamyl-tRNA(Gln) amidotransferase subunit C [Ignavibacteria bacterium]MCC6885921.1 Asp-tRNA(Asn)/Glu-tRNA(Gln) amidotransferase subunit GatC [Ignavibacteriales bacterium]MCE7953422.1 Asp-tRNA(Asn)/Glu-tRNA(Gln) amidotransferase subunit GatC [Chlorobi bacterium CHB7]MDL1887358.1 Asp-tRNA
MAVTIKDVEDIAVLAKLRFSEDEKQKLQKDMNKILEYIDELNELDLTNVEPLENINDTENVVRKDEAEPWLTTEEALSNAPDKTGRYFKVPKVLDK